MKRFFGNPIITRHQLQSSSHRLKDVSSIFNPGAVKHENMYLLLTRVQNRGRESYILKATSPTGYEFSLATEPVQLDGIGDIPGKVYHVYDPRITGFHDSYYVTTAVDTDRGCYSAIWSTDNFESLQLVSCVSISTGRNLVLFPEKINDRFCALFRPNLDTNDGVASGSTITLIESEDLIKWRHVDNVIEGRPHYWDELIGSGPPPIRTVEGWLHIYHGIATHFGSANIYQAGVLLLDSEKPTKVIARTTQNILEPREMYEMVGQVPNVVFPSGMIVDNVDVSGIAQNECGVKIYYGAADTVVGLVETTIGELLDAAKER